MKECIICKRKLSEDEFEIKYDICYDCVDGFNKHIVVRKKKRKTKSGEKNEESI